MVDKAAIKILVVDDDRFQLMLIARMLANLGFTRVIICEGGLRALATLDGTDVHPDLILLDLNMPHMDGIEVLRNLVERHFTGSLMLVSAEDKRMLQSAELLVQAHRLTLLGHLHKPFSPEALARLLEKFTPRRDPVTRAAPTTYSAEELRSAIAKGELVNHYQPMIQVATRKVVGVEALVRWRHPVDGLVFPDQFIGAAEAHGLIDDLTRAVLTEALAQAESWKTARLALRVAVNLSMDNLTSFAFADLVSDLTEKAGLSPKDVVLEVTESRLMKDLRSPLEILTRLRLRRFKLSIDDFGTGNSSLTQLRTLPFDELKIDQSFVHGAWGNPTVRAIFDASLGLAKQLGMHVVAEGVEDRDDWNYILKSGCHQAQGYFIARPMPAADLPAWTETWRGRMQEFPPLEPGSGKPL